MNLLDIMQSKPVLIGVHLGAAILGIDIFLWLWGRLREFSSSHKARVAGAALGLGAFLISWIAGGYYYVRFYGTLVKPVIKSGLAPWAHNIIMETKEHIFLFIIPLAATVLCAALLDKEQLERLGLRRPVLWLAGIVIGLAFLIGAMGFIISAAARWGVVTTIPS